VQLGNPRAVDRPQRRRRARGRGGHRRHCACAPAPPAANMIALAGGLSYLDLHFQGVPRVIATVVAHASGAVALIDPGPSTTLPMLRSELERSGMAMSDVTTLV